MIHISCKNYKNIIDTYITNAYFYRKINDSKVTL